MEMELEAVNNELERCYNEVCHVTISNRGVYKGNAQVGLRARRSDKKQIWVNGSKTLLSERNSLIPLLKWAYLSLNPKAINEKSIVFDHQHL